MFVVIKGSTGGIWSEVISYQRPVPLDFCHQFLEVAPRRVDSSNIYILRPLSIFSAIHGHSDRISLDSRKGIAGIDDFSSEGTA